MHSHSGLPVEILPQSITIDLGVVRDSVDMLMYQPRRFGSTEGNITSYTHQREMISLAGESIDRFGKK
jgi:hypothetical protein